MKKRIINETDVFKAALTEFTVRNYEEASVNNIIKNANISKGSFYYRFENKYELYLHLLKESNKIKWEYINSETQNNNVSESPKNIFDLFLYQAQLGASFAKLHPMFHKLSKMFSKEKGTELYKKVIKELGIEDDAGLEKLINGAIERGDFSNAYSKDFIMKVTQFLFSSFDEIFFQDEDFKLDLVLNYLKDFVRFMKSGLSAEK